MSLQHTPLMFGTKYLTAVQGSIISWLASIPDGIHALATVTHAYAKTFLKYGTCASTYIVKLRSAVTPSISSKSSYDILQLIFSFVIS